MRQFVLLACFIVSLDTANGVCEAPVTLSCSGGFFAARALNAPNITNTQMTNMKVANSILKPLTNGIGPFFQKFLDLDATKFVKVLKGVTLVGDLLPLFVSVENPETKTIVTELKTGFDNLSKQLKREMESLRDFVGEQFFSYKVLNKVRAAATEMNDLINRTDVQDPVRKENFIMTYEDASVHIAVRHILENAKERFRSSSLQNNYNNTAFISTKNAITDAFFKTFALRSFLIGMASKCRSRTKAQAALEKEAGKKLQEFNKMMEEVEDEFFKKFVEEQVVKKVFSSSSSKANCALAKNIFQEINANFPRRPFSVVVSVGLSTFKHYYQTGDKSRSVIFENYFDKNVIVFMATANFTQNRQQFVKNLNRKKLVKLGNIKINSTDFQTLGNFITGVNKTLDTQAALFANATLRPCIEQTSPENTYAFAEEQFVESVELGPFQPWIQYFVNF